MPALRQPPNLRSFLCKSKLYPVKRSDRVKRGTHKDAPGWKKCVKPCPVFLFTLPDCAEVVSQNTSYIHTIVDPLSCDTENCVYYWKCVKGICQDYPECEYIGMTSRKFKQRMSEHRDYPKRDVLTEPSGEHFTKRGYNVGESQNRDPYVLKSR